MLFVIFKNIGKRLSKENLSIPSPISSKPNSENQFGFSLLQEHKPSFVSNSDTPSKPPKHSNIKFSFMRSMSKSNSRIDHKPNKHNTTKPTQSHDLVQTPKSSESIPLGIPYNVIDTPSRQELNIATITRRRFSSSQYDEHFKSHHIFNESPTSEIKVLCLHEDFVVDLHEFEWFFNFLLKTKIYLLRFLIILKRCNAFNHCHSYHNNMKIFISNMN